MAKPEFTTVWSWDGPPRLAVQRAEVSRNGRTWQQHRFVAGHAPGVVVAAVTATAMAFVRIWRPTVGELRLELPRGFGESGVAEEDALRELREETGLTAGSTRTLGQFETDTGIMPTSMVALEALVGDTHAAPADGEADRTEWVALDEISDRIAQGELTDAISLAALALWSARRS